MSVFAKLKTEEFQRVEASALPKESLLGGLYHRTQERKAGVAKIRPEKEALDQEQSKLESQIQRARYRKTDPTDFLLWQAQVELIKKSLADVQFELQSAADNFGSCEALYYSEKGIYESAVAIVNDPSKDETQKAMARRQIEYAVTPKK